MDNIIISLPDELENLKLPSAELLMYYENLKHRILWIEGEIDDYSLEYMRHILQWNREDRDIPVTERKPIKLMFNSPGGDLEINNILIDTIKMSKTPIYGYNVGYACSAGCYIFLACHKRFMFPRAYFLLHKGSVSNLKGTHDEVVAAMNDYTQKVKVLIDYIRENTKIPEEVLSQKISTEWYMYAKEAMEYGLCEGIVTDINDLL